MYKEKLDTLYVTSKVDMKRVREVQDIDLIFDRPNSRSLIEFGDMMFRIMQKYNIGKYVSKNHWGVKGYKDIQTSLYDSVKNMFLKRRPTNQFQIFDDLKNDVSGKRTKNYTPVDYMRVARTEGKRMSVIYQLEEMKKAGVKYVRYATRNDNRVRDEHRLLNGREYEIDYLLSPEGEKDRIPLGINCRCRYIMSMRGL